MTNYDVGKDIGILQFRIEQLETAFCNLMDKSPPEEFEDLSHRLSYPIYATVTSNTDQNKHLCKAVQESMYTVELLKTNDGIPTLMKSEMSRADLDDYIAKNPGKNFSEFIVSVQPSFKEYI